MTSSTDQQSDLWKDDINRAWEVLTREIIINSNRTEASITVKHARYTGPNPESALAQTTATEADGLRLTVCGEVAGDQYASVELTMRTLSCEYFITSENEAWFLRKREQVSQLRRSLRPWYGWVRPFTLVLVSALSLVSAFSYEELAVGGLVLSNRAVGSEYLGLECSVFAGASGIYFLKRESF